MKQIETMVIIMICIKFILKSLPGQISDLNIVDDPHFFLWNNCCGSLGKLS